MTAEQARKMAITIHVDEFLELSLDGIYLRISKYASNHNFDTSFYGIIPEHIQKLLESDGFRVQVFNFPPQQPMTAVYWD